MIFGYGRRKWRGISCYLPLILLLPPPSPEEKASMLKDYQNISTMG